MHDWPTTGTVVEPCLFGRNLEIHPVVIMLALALWYSLWGMVGALFAVPITAVLKIILQQLEHPYAEVFLDLLELRLPRILEASVAPPSPRAYTGRRGESRSSRSTGSGSASGGFSDDDDDDVDPNASERWRADAALAGKGRPGGAGGAGESSSSSGGGKVSPAPKPLLDLSGGADSSPARSRGRSGT